VAGCRARQYGYGGNGIAFSFLAAQLIGIERIAFAALD
jgi:hypothetical protein